MEVWAVNPSGGVVARAQHRSNVIMVSRPGILCSAHLLSYTHTHRIYPLPRATLSSGGAAEPFTTRTSVRLMWGNVSVSHHHQHQQQRRHHGRSKRRVWSYVYPKCYTPKTLEWDSPPLDKSRPIISHNNNSSIIESTKVKSDLFPRWKHAEEKGGGRERETVTVYWAGVVLRSMHLPWVSYPPNRLRRANAASVSLLCGKVPVRKRGFVERWTRTRCLVLLITRIEVLLQNDCCCGLIFIKKSNNVLRICWTREIAE